MPGPLTGVVESVTGTARQPIGAVGAVAAMVTGPAGVLTGPLGTLLTAPLSTEVLRALTAPFTAVLGQLTRFTRQLIPRVIDLLRPVAGLLEPIGRLTLPGAVAGAAPIITALLPAVTAPVTCQPIRAPTTAGSWPAIAPPTGSGHVATGGSIEQQLANPPAAPVDDRPLGAGPRASSTRVLCGQWPQPPRSPDVPHAHMSGQSNGPFSPGAPHFPASGGSTGTLPTSSHHDGASDTPRSWQAHVPDTFVPARVVVTPVVRTAADEPAYSPD